MKKLFFILLILSSLTNRVFSQKDTIWPFINSKLLGNYKITSGNKVQTVTIKIETVHFKKDSNHGWNETDVSILVSDSRGSVLYKKNYPGDQDGQLNISVDSIFFEGIGNMLLIHYSNFPRCGGCGEDVQIFGLNNLGYLVPYTGVIRVYDNISNNALFNVKWATTKTDLISGVYQSDFKNCKNCNPYLELIIPSGFGNLIALGYYPLEKEGTSEQANFQEIETDRMPLRIDDSNYFTIQQVEEDDENDRIQLYANPDDASQSKIMQVKKGMIVKFFESLDNKWIHLRIAGFEGYIEWNELWKLGLPAHE